ncbi:energy transducer TonB [Parapedomonas caeni]
MMLQTSKGHVRAARRNPLPRTLLRPPVPASPGAPLRDGRLAVARPRAAMNWPVIALVGALHAAALVALALSRIDLPVLTVAPALRVDLLPAAAPLPPPPPPPALAPPALPLPVFVMPDIAPPAPAPTPVLAAFRPPGAPGGEGTPGSGQGGATVAPSAADSAPVTAPDFEADYLNNPAPPYPMASRRAREQGTVMLRVLVSPAGTAQMVELEASSGFSRLDHAASDAVRRWRFVPASQSGRPVTAWVLVPVIFSLAR